MMDEEYRSVKNIVMNMCKRAMYRDVSTSRDSFQDRIPIEFGKTNTTNIF